MSREIRFRGKHVVTGEWFYGSLLADNIIGRVHIINGKPVVTEHCVVDPETVGQFTGHLDKNNNQIYEHDILLGLCVEDYQDDPYYHKSKTVVHWNKKTACFHMNSYLPIDWGGYASLEVVGDVFKNPEIITNE